MCCGTVESDKSFSPLTPDHSDNILSAMAEPFRVLDHNFDLQVVLGDLEKMTGYGISMHVVGNLPVLSEGRVSLPTERERGRYHHSDFCEAAKTTPEGLRACIQCDQHEGNPLAGQAGRPILRTCHMGLVEVLVPVFVEGQHVATLFGGQARGVAPSGQEREAQFKHWAELGLDIRQMSSRIVDLPLAHPERMEALGRILDALAQYLSVRATTQTIHQAMVDRSAAPVQQALRHMTENLEKDLSLEKVARQVHLSPSRLSHLFSRFRKESFRDSLQRLRIERARQLLSTTDLPVNEVAFKVGYEPQFFSRTFKKAVEMTPGEYRQLSQKP